MKLPNAVTQLGGRRRGVVLPIILLVVMAALPAFGLSANMMRLLFITLVWVTTSLAWNLLGGFAGQVSFGFAVFFGLGAYSAALLINHGLNPYLSFVGAAIVPALASYLIGLPTFRLRGPYFAIATIGVSEAVRVIMVNSGFTGGASGYRITEHVPFRQAEHYETALGMAALAVAFSLIVSRSKFGLGLVAIRQDQDAAADLGLNPFAYKLWAHAAAAALAGIAGGVFARYSAYINPDSVFAFRTSVYILLMPVIGGIGTVWGAVLGGVIFGIVEEEFVANFPQIHLLLYGSLLILIILAEPDGVLGLMKKLMRRYRGRQRPKDAHPEGGEPDEAVWRTSRA